LGCCIFIGVLEFGSDFLLCIYIGVLEFGLLSCYAFSGVLAFGLLVFGPVFVWAPLLSSLLCGATKGFFFDSLCLAVGAVGCLVVSVDGL
jgi:hypothetical protein